MKFFSLIMIILSSLNIVNAQVKKTKQKLIIYKSHYDYQDDYSDAKVFNDRLIEYEFDIDTNVIHGYKNYRHFINLDTVKNLEKHHLQTLVSKKRYVYKENGLFGIKTKKGKIKEKAQFDVFYKSSQGFYYARNDHNNLWGLFDKNLKPIVNCEYNDIYCQDFKKGCFVQLGKYWGSVDSKGKLMIPIYYKLKKFTSDSLFLGINSDCEELLTIENDTLFSKNDGCIKRHFEYQNKSQVIYEKNGKYGVIDNSGSNILTPDYDEILTTYIRGNETRSLGYLLKNNNRWSLLLNGKMIFSSLEFVNPLKNNNWSALNLNFYKSNGLLGIVKNDWWNGLMISPAIYDNLSKIKPITSNNFEDFYSCISSENLICYGNDSRVTNNYLYAKKDSFWGIVDLSGVAITDFKYQEIYYYNKKVFIAKKNNKWGILDTYGKEISSFKWDKIGKKNIDSKYIKIQENGLFGLIDINANIILQPQYQEIVKLKISSRNTLVKVRKDNKWGVLDLDKRNTGNFDLSSIESKSNLSNPNQDVFSTIVQLKGSSILDLIYDEIDRIKVQKHFFIKVRKGDYWILFDTLGQQITNDVYHSIISTSNSIYAKRQDGKSGSLYNSDGNNLKFIYDEISLGELNKKYYLIKFHDKYGLLNQENKLILKCKYDDIQHLKTLSSENKYFKIKEGDIWKFIKIDNSEIYKKNNKYSEISTLSSSFFKVKINDKYGIINDNDSLIINCQFDEIKFIPNKFAYKGLFAAKIKTKWKIFSIVKNDLYHFKRSGKIYNIKNHTGFILDSIDINEKYQKHNYLKVVINGKFGLLDSYNNFNLALDCKFDGLEELSSYRNRNYIYKVNNKGKWRIIEINEDRIKQNSSYKTKATYKRYNVKLLSSLEFDSIGKTLDKKTFIVKQNHLFGILSKSHEFYIKPKYKKITKLNNSYLGFINNNSCEEISDKGKITIISNEKKLKKQKLKFNLFRQQKGCYFGIVDEKDSVILDYKYTKIEPFIEKGKNYPYDLAKIKNFEKEGYVLTDGSILVEPVYDVLKAFQEGMARVKRNGKWGFIDTAGKLVIDLKYDYVEAFIDGKSKVTVKNKTFFINKKGKIIK